METGGVRRLNRSSPSCLNTPAQRTDFLHGLQVVLCVLFGFTGSAAYALGGVLTTLNLLGRAGTAADPPVHRVTAPSGERCTS